MILNTHSQHPKLPFLSQVQKTHPGYQTVTEIAFGIKNDECRHPSGCSENDIDVDLFNVTLERTDNIFQ
jgi:hypothetical protein